MKILLRILFIVIITASLGILGYRAGYDFYMIHHGDTFFVKKSSPDGYDYLLQIPKGYNDYSGKQPLLIFLHGAGETGKAQQTIQFNSPYHLSRKTFNQRETALFPFICVTPLCDTKRWQPYRIMIMLEQVLKENRHRFAVDASRIYLTGYSMGGFGALETAMEYPDRFAAVVPVAGGGEPCRAEKLRDVPVWFFHGGSDNTVPLPSSALLTDALNNPPSANVKQTVIKDAGHAIAADVYAREELYQWLLYHRQLPSVSSPALQGLTNF